MDMDKNNKGEKKGEKKAFQQVFSVSTPAVVCGYDEKPLTLWATRGASFNGSAKKGERKRNIVESCLWSRCQRG